MAWLGLDKLFLGVDLTAEQQRAQQLDAGITAANQQLVDAGYWDQATFDQAQTDIAAGNVSTGTNDVLASVDSEFAAGAQQGLQNVLHAPGAVVGAVGSGASTLLWGILKNIPWWVWIVGLGALFVWMGGLSLLRGRFAR
jgi:hypothetical protein